MTAATPLPTPPTQAPARRAWRQSWGCTPSGGRDPFVIGTAVRLVSGKGVERLLEAFPAPPRGPRLRISCGGTVAESPLSAVKP